MRKLLIELERVKAERDALRREIDEAPVVARCDKHLGAVCELWSSDDRWSEGTTHRARLVRIEEIPKEKA